MLTNKHYNKNDQLKDIILLGEYYLVEIRDFQINYI